jgi:hypothetical protein
MRLRLVTVGAELGVPRTAVGNQLHRAGVTIAAGITAGSWYASPATHVGYELIAAGMLILAGGGRGLPLDYDELERWTRVGYEHGTRSGPGER